VDNSDMLIRRVLPDGSEILEERIHFENVPVGALEGYYAFLPPSLKLRPGEDYRGFFRNVLGDVVDGWNSVRIPNNRPPRNHIE